MEERRLFTSAHFSRSLRGKLQNKQHGGPEQRACIVERRRGAGSRDDGGRCRRGPVARGPRQARGLPRARQEATQDDARRGRRENRAEAGAPSGRHPLLRSMPRSASRGRLSGRSAPLLLHLLRSITSAGRPGDNERLVSFIGRINKNCSPRKFLDVRDSRVEMRRIIAICETTSPPPPPFPYPRRLTRSSHRPFRSGGRFLERRCVDETVARPSVCRFASFGGRV